jgi:hypothetical protein
MSLTRCRGEPAVIQRCLLDTGGDPVKHASLVLAAVVVVLGLQGLGRADAPAGVQKWEYRFVVVVGTTNPLVEDPKLAEGAKALQGLLTDQVRRLGLEAVDMKDLQKFLTEAGLAGWKVHSREDTGWLLERPRT